MDDRRRRGSPDRFVRKETFIFYTGRLIAARRSRTFVEKIVSIKYADLSRGGVSRARQGGLSRLKTYNFSVTLEMAGKPRVQGKSHNSPADIIDRVACKSRSTFSIKRGYEAARRVVLYFST